MRQNVAPHRVPQYPLRTSLENGITRDVLNGHPRDEITRDQSLTLRVWDYVPITPMGQSLGATLGMPLAYAGEWTYGPDMGTSLPTVRLPQFFVETAHKGTDRIRTLVRMESPTLTTACRQAGLPNELAAMCGGLLASVIDDLVTIGRLKRSDFERTKRKQRVLAAADEPARSALRLAVAASPINGRAAVAHWDTICEKPEVGKLAWLLGLDTETSYKYGKRQEHRT